MPTKWVHISCESARRYSTQRRPSLQAAKSMRRLFWQITPRRSQHSSSVQRNFWHAGRLNSPASDEVWSALGVEGRYPRLLQAELGAVRDGQGDCAGPQAPWQAHHGRLAANYKSAGGDGEHDAALSPEGQARLGVEHPGQRVLV
eukprot:3645558-Pleurochrysis_carterae.AAC.1